MQRNQVNLEDAKNWKPKNLNRYEGQDGSQLLVKKAVTTFSYFNPSLQTRQERTETLVFDKDGSTVLGIIQNGKFRQKK